MAGAPVHSLCTTIPSLGVPYAVLVVLFKWLAIGRFTVGPTSPSLDYRRWILFNLMQSRLMQAFMGINMTSQVRVMGEDGGEQGCGRGRVCEGCVNAKAE